jgi:BirA family biotin operon repressor/biotin-[acetyl-CoA-carboxylase] ligase
VIAWTVHRVGTTGSTSDDALARVRAGAPHGTVLLADAQTKGRGRGGRTWISPPGANLYLSVILRPVLLPHEAPPLTLAAAVAVCDAVRGLGCRATIKWPNDVLVDDKKVAGILTESSTRGGRLEAVVIGIGINVNWTELPPELAPTATSLALALGHAVDRDRLASDLLAALGQWIGRHLADGAAPIARAWRERAATLGRRVSTIQGTGLARDIDDDGALIVELDDGETVLVRSGELL